jgi:hypothetical protein
VFRCLRTIQFWCDDRDVFHETATEIRAEFNANKNIPVGKISISCLIIHKQLIFFASLHTDSGITVRLLREARDRLSAQTHPDPYIAPYMPGTTPPTIFWKKM